MTTSPLLTLNNGVQMPAIGLGVFQSSPDDTVTAVESAIAEGYRLIDTAASYFNERQVGDGVRRSGISRDHIFIETKVWISDYGYEATLHAFDKSAGKLGVERLDLLLLHQPLPSRFDLTLECIRLHYLGETSPLADTLNRYGNFFSLFEDFHGYTNFFLLQDLASEDSSTVKFLMPFAHFTTSPFPRTVEEYQYYRENGISFVQSRNRRMAEYIVRL